MDITPFFTAVVHAQETAQSVSPTEVLGIQLKLFLGQLVTFSIVLFILWKWVFTPVSKKLGERTDRIEQSLKDAERITREKQEFEQWRQEELSKARTEASAIITKAQTDSGRVKDQMLQETKEQQQKLVDEAKKQIIQEKQEQLSSAKAELAQLITLAAEKVLRQKLDEKKDADLIKQSLKEL